MSLTQQLVQDGILLDPRIPTHWALIRQEVESFAELMRRGQGRVTDNPPMFFSGIPNNPVTQTNARSQEVMVISVGGTSTHFRVARIENDTVHSLEPSRETRLQSVIPTPCGDSKQHSLDEMIQPIAAAASDWLIAYPDTSHLVINWGFPQLSYSLPKDQGITGATVAKMTKYHHGVDAVGEDVGQAFREALQLGERPLKITVQNDTILAAQRYVGSLGELPPFRKLCLMILGTGANLTTAEPYLFDKDGKAKRSENGTRAFWVNYEIAQVPLVITRHTIDRTAASESSEVEPSIENFGLSGTGFPRIFENLIHDYLPEGKALWEKLQAIYPDFSARTIAELATQFGQSGLHKHLSAEVCSQVEALATVVLKRSALRAAELLAATSLFSGLGLPEEEGQTDLLGMEGSLWKIPSYQAWVREAWTALLQPELSRLGRQELPVQFRTLDDYNASVLGPVYLVKNWGSNPL